MIYYTLIYYTIFTALLVAAAYCAWQISKADFRRRIIPDVFLFPLMILGMIVVQFFSWITTPAMSVIGGAFGYTLGITVGYIFARYAMHDEKTPAPIGMGDIKLLGAGGIWLGPTGLAFALVLACISGGIWARIHHHRYIPFAPFFLGGGILTLIGMFFLL